MAIIELNNIIKKYKRFTAIDGVSLSVEPGEIFGLLGSNGAGKTTLIKIAAGLLEADGGDGTVLGYDIYKEHKKIRAKVSLVAPTADVGTDNNLTVRQNLEFWAVIYDLEKSQRKTRIDEMLDFLNLRPYEHHWPMSISAGNRQKLAIARSLLVKNPLLFLDEPTVKLDAEGAEAVRGLVKKINAEFGTTVILTTHYIFEAEALCERAAIMHSGKMLSCGTVNNLRARLHKPNEIIINCETGDEIINAVTALPFVVSCEKTAQGLAVRTQSADNTFAGTETKLAQVKSTVEPFALNEILKLLRAKNVSINGAFANELTLEDIFMDTIGGEHIVR